VRQDLDHLCHNADLQCPGGRGCPHRRCVRPDHLEVVTRQVNVRRGRSPAATGARSARLAGPIEAEIRDLYARGGMSQEQLARRYGVTRTVIRGALRHTRAVGNPTGAAHAAAPTPRRAA
jgi:hypothetical protein